MVVLVQVQLFVPEFTVTHLLPYLLTIPLCGQWKVQWPETEYWLCFSVGYYSTWLWIRLSILSCGAIFAGFVQVINFLTSYRWGDSTVFTERCDWPNVGHPADLFKGILIDSNLPVTCWHPSFIVVLTAPKSDSNALLSSLNQIWKIGSQRLLFSSSSSILSRWSPRVLRGKQCRLSQA